MEATPKTIIFYHGNCPDGFGGAYSAWKKFGDSATYQPLSYGKPLPEVPAGADIYFIDFCYPQEDMDRLAQGAHSFTVLDHHLGTREIVESFPSHVFDENRSGSTIAWEYFHPNTPVPSLLSYVEDGDLYRFALPNARALLTYAYTKDFAFDEWDALVAQLQDPAERAAAVTEGSVYSDYFAFLVQRIAEKADHVLFEGYECYLASASSQFASDVGHVLYEKYPPLALVASVRADGIRVSLRGNGTIDLTKIAQKYGGNGHPNAAGFSLPYGSPIPWTPVKDDETTGN